MFDEERSVKRTKVDESTEETVESSTTIPIEIWQQHIAQYLGTEDIFNLRIASRWFRERVFPAHHYWKVSWPIVDQDYRYALYHRSKEIVARLKDLNPKTKAAFSTFPIYDVFTAYVITRYGAYTRKEYFIWLSERFRRDSLVVKALFDYPRRVTQKVYAAVPEKSEYFLRMAYINVSDPFEGDFLTWSIPEHAASVANKCWFEYRDRQYGDYRMLYQMIEYGDYDYVHRFWPDAFADTAFHKGAFQYLAHTHSIISLLCRLRMDARQNSQAYYDMFMENLEAKQYARYVRKRGGFPAPPLVTLLHDLLHTQVFLENPKNKDWAKSMLAEPDIVKMLIDSTEKKRLPQSISYLVDPAAWPPVQKVEPKPKEPLFDRELIEKYIDEEDRHLFLDDEDNNVTVYEGV